MEIVVDTDDDAIVLMGLKILVKKHQAIIDMYVEEAAKITGDTTEFTHDWFWDFPTKDFTAQDLLASCKKDRNRCPG